MRSDDATPAVRVSAANAILDRGWGKAAQPVENGEDGVLELITGSNASSCIRGARAAVPLGATREPTAVKDCCSDQPFFLESRYMRCALSGQ